MLLNEVGLVTFCTVALALLSSGSLADDRLQVDLGNKISIEQVNRELEERDRQTPQENHIYFAFDLRSGPLEDARQYLPFLNYLANATGYNFKLRFTPKGASIVDDLGTGKAQFAAIGAVSFVLAQEQYGIVSLARGINSQGRSEYQSIIVVSTQSDVQNIADLKGKRFAFGSASSTQGHLIPRITLEGHGISLSDFAAFDYTGSHYDCANAVVKGAFDACGMQDTMARKMTDEGLIKILHTSPYYPSSGIVAAKEVPRVVVENVKQALLDFDPQGRDRNLLHDWHLTEMPNGFEASSPADYAELRRWLIRLDMMQAVNANPSDGVH